MIDIHSHILPFVDDGSDGMEKSLSMLRKCMQEGVTDLILTPHHRRTFVASREKLQAEFMALEEAKKQSGINVNLYLGQEIYYKNDTKELLNKGELLALNGSKYILIEFGFFEYRDVAEAVYELKAAGYIPVVAHPERYTYFSLSDAQEVKELGGLIQVNAPSISGDSKKACLKKVKRLFKEGLVDFVSSDAHYGRNGSMAEAYKWVKKKFGTETAEKTFTLNAKKIIESRN